MSRGSMPRADATSLTFKNSLNVNYPLLKQKFGATHWKR